MDIDKLADEYWRSDRLPERAKRVLSVMDLREIAQPLLESIKALAERIKELEARLEEEQLSRRDCIPVIQANKDIHKAVELAETMLRKRIEELEAQVEMLSTPATDDYFKARIEELEATLHMIAEPTDITSVEELGHIARHALKARGE